MGTSVSVIAASDADIDRFRQSTGELERLLGQVIPFTGTDRCFLADYWDWVHVLLTGETSASPLPAGLIKRGEVNFADASDPTHAVYSSTTKALAAELPSLTHPVLWDRLLRHAGLETPPVFPGRYFRQTPVDPHDQDVGELMGYFEAFRDYISKAAREDKALIVCRYEDW